MSVVLCICESLFNFSSIETWTGSNYKKWKQDVEIVLGFMDLDLALREDEPAALTNESSDAHRRQHEKQHKANRMSLLIMKRAMTETVRGGIPSNDKEKAFLEVIGEKFKESKKAEMRSLMNALTIMRYDGESSAREYIMKLIDIANKLKDLEVTIYDPFLMHVALNSLPPKFGQLKVSYNTQKENWDLNELISMCVQEEDRLKRDQMEVVNLVHSTYGKKNGASGTGSHFMLLSLQMLLPKLPNHHLKGLKTLKSTKLKFSNALFAKSVVN
ncbi:uncharacterized protein LOC110758061 [Prunus avium]|uniref:Uncharacterized protein LOC110758061 n=1 Tax=Prunus avium TaxID=42229 RepID=A0A6P5SPH1_PRUAV|nr:uncharacterized protein LOC110758061 [Prunus avium]